MDDIEWMVQRLRRHYLGGGVTDDSRTPTIVAGGNNFRGEAGHVQLGPDKINYTYAIHGKQDTVGVCTAVGGPSTQGELVVLADWYC